MSLRRQLRWGGLWIMVVSLLVSVTNILVYAGKDNAAIQAVHFAGYTGLVLTCTIIHIAQAQRAGLLGLVAYLLSVLGLVYSNSVTFLTLAELAGIEEMAQALDAVGATPVMGLVMYGVFLGLMLIGLAVARAGILPRWGGILLSLGIGLQVPAQFARDVSGPVFYIFTIGGSVIFGVGLLWIGWAMWSGRGLMAEDPPLSNLDRLWGAPFVMLSASLTMLNAYINSVPDLTLLDGTINLLSLTALIFAIVILHTAQAEHAGGIGLAGFFLIHLGSTLLVITAYFIWAQLAGQLENNSALMASWVDIPVGRYGNYLLMLGTFLFGVSAVRGDVFPRWSGWLVAIGLALLLPSQFQSQDYLFTIFWVIGASLQGVGLGWMGWTLWQKKHPEQIVQLRESTP